MTTGTARGSTKAAIPTLNGTEFDTSESRPRILYLRFRPVHAHAARTRHLRSRDGRRPGHGGGTRDAAAGRSCIAERRVRETIDSAKPATPVHELRRSHPHRDAGSRGQVDLRGDRPDGRALHATGLSRARSGRGGGHEAYRRLSLVGGVFACAMRRTSRASRSSMRHGIRAFRWTAGSDQKIEMFSRPLTGGGCSPSTCTLAPGAFRRNRGPHRRQSSGRPLRWGLERLFLLGDSSCTFATFSSTEGSAGRAGAAHPAQGRRPRLRGCRRPTRPQAGHPAGRCGRRRRRSRWNMAEGRHRRGGRGPAPGGRARRRRRHAPGARPGRSVPAARPRPAPGDSRRRAPRRRRHRSGGTPDPPATAIRATGRSGGPLAAHRDDRGLPVRIQRVVAAG